jgi:carboxyl-terminal processing protease
MMRGKDSKDREIVKLIVLRKGEKEPLEIKVKRDLIKTKSVKARREGDIIYLRIASFTSQTYNEMIKEFNIVENDIGKKNVKGLVLDLRNNPGGLLDSSILISDAFLDKGKKIVSIRGKEDSLVREYFDKEEQDLIPNIPMVVLINEGSASASEIVSGALQDHKRAIILGTKSFGKGSVQSLIPLNNGGAIKLTVAKYYTPNDVSIQAKGIIPDIEVELAKLEKIDSNKWSYNEGSLKGHLENRDNKDNKDSKENNKENDLVKKELLKHNLRTDNESMYNKDYQLARAIDLLLGISFYNLEKK